MQRPRGVAAAARATFVAGVLVVLGALVASLTAAATSAPTSTDSTTWTYDEVAHRLVGPPGSEPFWIKNGTAVEGAYGEWAVRFTFAPGVAQYTGSAFPVPGFDDFAWTVDVAVDHVRPKSSANVAQVGRYRTHQIKVQLTRKGKAQCVLNGSGGRVKVTSSASSLDDGALRHSVTCWRSGGTVGVTVDCLTTSKAFALGKVSPSAKATVGNKSLKAKAGDQLFGRVWHLTVEHGPDAGPPC